jgi:hypothetical protein
MFLPQSEWPSFTYMHNREKYCSVYPNGHLFR